MGIPWVNQVTSEQNKLALLRSIWCVEDHRVLTSRMSISAVFRNACSVRFNDIVTSASQAWCCWGLDWTAWIILGSWFCTSLNVTVHYAKRNTNLFNCWQNSWQHLRGVILIALFFFIFLLANSIVVEGSVNRSCNQILVIVISFLLVTFEHTNAL